jgi:hypothetical protein
MFTGTPCSNRFDNSVDEYPPVVRVVGCTATRGPVVEPVRVK